MSDNISLIFSGQGSFIESMGIDLIENSEVARKFFEEACSELPELEELILKSTSEEVQRKLILTENQQPAILCFQIMVFKALMEKHPDLENKISSYAGHSLGEISALVASGAIDAVKAISLARKRGKMMQKACPEGYGKLSVLLSDDLGTVREMLEKSGRSVYLANDNSDNQIVIAGECHDMMWFLGQASAFSPVSLKIVNLPVSVPFHTPILNKVASKFSAYLKKNIKINSDKVLNVHSCLKGDIYGEVSEEKARYNLSMQISNPVKWRSVQEKIVTSEAEHIIEISPVKVLSKMMKKAYPDLKYSVVRNNKDIIKLEGKI